MELDEIITISKINFTDCLVEPDSGSRLDWSFDISPLEFLSFSKSDLREAGKRGPINALTNAKRAIDCQIDRIFKAFGYEFDDFPKYLENFCEFFCEDDRSKDLPIKLKVINAFGMAPAGLVSDVRNLRNKMEHYYNVPSIDDVRKAIEVAELFIAATEKKLIDYWEFQLTDNKHRDSVEHGKLCGLYITKKFDSEVFEVRYDSPFQKDHYTVEVAPNKESYAPLMRLCISLDQEEEFKRSLIYLLKINAHKVPENKINVNILYF